MTPSSSSKRYTDCASGPRVSGYFMPVVSSKRIVRDSDLIAALRLASTIWVVCFMDAYFSGGFPGAPPKNTLV